MLLNKTKLAFVVYNYKNVMKKDGEHFCSSILNCLLISPFFLKFGCLIRHELAKSATVICPQSIQPFLCYFATTGHVAIVT